MHEGDEPDVLVHLFDAHVGAQHLAHFHLPTLLAQARTPGHHARPESRFHLPLSGFRGVLGLELPQPLQAATARPRTCYAT